MTFDDGLVVIYDVANKTEPGAIPQKVLKESKRFFYSIETAGIKRIYEAVRANQQIDLLIAVYRDEQLSTNQIAETENGDQFIIRTIQHMNDENNIKITKLGLERQGEKYEIIR